MIKTPITISNKLGLHARASAKLTKLAGSFPCARATGDQLSDQSCKTPPHRHRNP
jgi:phosphotransferase system HPr-like phosphotransfer protein